ncbi:MAG: glycosyltransferase family 4 protein [bacterium]
MPIPLADREPEPTDAPALRVLRLCSVFEPDVGQVGRPQFDPIGGMQNHTASLTRTLDRLGVEQTVVTSRLGDATGVTPLGRCSEVVRVGLPTRRVRQAWAAAAFRAAKSRGPFDVVHVHQGEDLAALPLAAALARRFDAAFVATLHCSLRHSVPAAGPRLTALRVVGGALEERLLGRADEVIVLTQTTRARLAAAGQACTVIPSGVESDLFRGATPSPLLAGIARPRVLYVGRLARQKAVPTLVRAFGLVSSPGSLVIVGDGPDRPAVDAAVAELPESVRRRVHRFGFRPHQEVPALLAAADVLALPSIYEEMGSILAEALQAGLPVVASAVGGIPDVVRPGRTGVLVPPGDPVALAGALERLVGSEGRRSAMRAACRAEATGYAWDGLAAQILNVYRRAVARRCSDARVAATRSMS